MKKLFVLLFVMCLSYSINAQNFNLVVSAGLPSGDASDLLSFAAIIDGSYLFEVSEGFNVGGATGFIYGFGDSMDTALGSIDMDDIGYIPLAAAARYSISEEFVVGADLGYGIGVTPSNIDSGFYYAPRAQYYFSEQTSVVAAYRSISVTGGSFDFLSLGVEFSL